MKYTISMVALCAAALVSGSCHDDLPSAPAPSFTTVVPSGGVQAAIQQEAPAADGSITLVVHVATRDVAVSSFQGVISFRAGSFQLLSAKTPSGGDGESFFVNQNDFSNGVIRFAAFTPRTFGGVSLGNGVEAFRFTVKPLRAIEQTNLVATLTAVGRETGARMAAELLLPSPGVHDADGRLLVVK